MKLVIHPPVEPERLAKIVEAARPMAVVNAADEAEARAAIADADAFFGKITPDLLARGAAAPLGAGAHGEPRALHVPGARGAPVRAHQHARALLGRHRRPRVRLRPLLRPELPPLHPEPAGGPVGAGRREARDAAPRGRSGRRAELEGGASGFVTGPAHVSAVDRSHLHLADATLGVVGLGQIGSEIARRGLAFGMRVLAVDPVQATAPPGVAALWRLDRLPDLLGESDFVVIAAPHTPETVKLFRRAQFRQMKPTAYLINIGRGAIVDLGDLVAALRAAEIAGAGLDVFETEPLPPDHPLWADAERHPDAARRRQLAADRRAPPRRPARQRAALRARRAPRHRRRQAPLVLRASRRRGAACRRPPAPDLSPGGGPALPGPRRSPPRAAPRAPLPSRDGRASAPGRPRATGTRRDPAARPRFAAGASARSGTETGECRPPTPSAISVMKRFAMPRAGRPENARVSRGADPRVPP